MGFSSAILRRACSSVIRGLTLRCFSAETCYPNGHHRTSGSSKLLHQSSTSPILNVPNRLAVRLVQAMSYHSRCLIIPRRTISENGGSTVNGSSSSLTLTPSLPGRTQTRGIRAIVARKTAMMKFKRVKRWKRDAFKYQKHKRRKRMRTEKEFKLRIANILSEAAEFSAETYVSRILTRARLKMEERKATLDDKALTPHWSELMTLEELYGLKKSDYIEKHAGVADDDDWAEVQKQRENYVAFTRRFFDAAPSRKKKHRGAHGQHDG